MAVVTQELPVAPDDVWDVLRDGWRYSNWVVGTSHMRAVDTDWPAPGTRLQHATGLWPLVLRDSTEVIECEPSSRLVLVAHGGVLGDARITMELTATAAGTEVRMTEVPVSGLGKWTDTPITEALIRRRNIEALGRLSALAERRTPPAAD